MNILGTAYLNTTRDHLIAFVSYLKVPTCGYKRMLISQAKDKTAEPYAVLLFRAGTL